MYAHPSLGYECTVTVASQVAEGGVVVGQVEVDVSKTYSVPHAPLHPDLHGWLTVTVGTGLAQSQGFEMVDSTMQSGAGQVWHLVPVWVMVGQCVFTVAVGLAVMPAAACSPAGMAAALLKGRSWYIDETRLGLVLG